MKALLLTTFLAFSHLLFLLSSSSSSALIPSSTGSPKPAGTTGDVQTSSGDQQPPSQDGESLDSVIWMDNSGEGVLSEEDEDEGLGGFMEGRMVIQSYDYPGTGANNRHDPKPPTD